MVERTVPALSASFKRQNTDKLSLLAGLVMCMMKRCVPPGMSVKSNGVEMYEAMRDVVLPGILTVVVFSAADTGSSESCL
jgi:hypothetical protein